MNFEFIDLLIFCRSSGHPKGASGAALSVVGVLGIDQWRSGASAATGWTRVIDFGFDWFWLISTWVTVVYRPRYMHPILLYTPFSLASMLMIICRKQSSSDLIV